MLRIDYVAHEKKLKKYKSFTCVGDGFFSMIQTYIDKEINKEVGKMSRILRFCTVLLISLFSFNAFADYTCPTLKTYTSCKAGYYLSDTPATDSDGNTTATNSCAICPVGYYCTGGTATKIECPAGTYGSTTGLKTSACSGTCSMGYYCPAGSTSSTQNNCDDLEGGGAWWNAVWTSKAGAGSAQQCYRTLTINKNGFTGTLSVKDPVTGVTKTATGTNNLSVNVYYMVSLGGVTANGLTDANGDPRYRFAGGFGNSSTCTSTNSLISQSPTDSVWYACKTVSDIKSRITLDSKFYSSPTATSGATPLTVAAPTPFFIKYGTTGYFTTSTSTYVVSQLTAVPTPGSGQYVFGGFFTGKAGTGTQVIDADGNLLSTMSKLYTSATSATWYAHYIRVSTQVVCDPGYYLAANATSCTKCEAGNYCDGGTYWTATYDQGKTKCPDPIKYASIERAGGVRTSWASDGIYDTVDTCRMFVNWIVDSNGIVNGNITNTSNTTGTTQSYNVTPIQCFYDTTLGDYNKCQMDTKYLTCDEGYYFGAGKEWYAPGDLDTLANSLCGSCEPGNYCPDGDISMTACPTKYSQSAIGATSETSCYTECSAGTLVTTPGGACTTVSGNQPFWTGDHRVYFGQISGINYCPMVLNNNTWTYMSTPASNRTSESACYVTIPGGKGAENIVPENIETITIDYADSNAVLTEVEFYLADGTKYDAENNDVIVTDGYEELINNSYDDDVYMFGGASVSFVNFNNAPIDYVVVHIKTTGNSAEAEIQITVNGVSLGIGEALPVEGETRATLDENGLRYQFPLRAYAIETCAAGSYSKGRNFYSGDSYSCTSCAIGAISAAGATACTACAAGTTTSSAGAASCTACYNARRTHSWATPQWNESTNTVSNVCKIESCIANSYLKSGNGNGYTNTCMTCASLTDGGIYATSTVGNSSGANACYVTVPAGKYLDDPDDSTLTTCPAGQYCPGTTLHYADIGGNNSCAAISGTGGLYNNSLAGSDAETDCYATTEKGYYIKQASDTSQTICQSQKYCPGDIDVYYPNSGLSGGMNACPNPTEYNPDNLCGYNGVDCGIKAGTNTSAVYNLFSWVNSSESVTGSATSSGAWKIEHCIVDWMYYENAAGDTAMYKCFWDEEAQSYSSGCHAYRYLSCSAGRYDAEAGASNSNTSCETCPNGSYCPGGSQTADDGVTIPADPISCSSLAGIPSSLSGTYSSVSPYETSSTCRFTANAMTVNGCSTVTANTVSYNGTAWGTNFYTAKAAQGYYVSDTNSATPSCTACAQGYHQNSTDFTGTSCTANNYTVVFNSNKPSTASTTMSGTMSNQSFNYGTPQNLSANAFSLPGYTFAGWNTKADGSGDSYANSESVSNLTDEYNGTVNLYAKWTANTYTISHNPNGGTRSGPPSITVTFDQGYTSSPVGASRTGYTFTGWYTAASNGSLVFDTTGNLTTETVTGYASGGKWVGLENKTLYAHWTPNEYTISFNANGGSGGQSADVTATYNNAMPTISTTAPTKTACKFMGWYDNATYTSGTQYYTAAGASARTWDKTENTTLYAGWNCFTVTAPSNKTLTYSGSAQSCASNPTVSNIDTYTVTFSESGTGTFNTTAPTITNVGTKTIYYRVSATDYTYYQGSYTCTMNPANGSTTIKDGTTDVTNGTGGSEHPGTKTLTITCAGGATSDIDAESGTESVASASVDGTIVTLTSKSTGESKITVTCPATTNYKASSATYTWKIENGVINVTTSNPSKTYDGTALTCNGVSNVVPSGATVMYGTTSDTYNLTSAPTITNVADSKTVFYQVTAENYTTKTGSFECSITPATMTVSATGNSKTYNGTALTCDGGTWTGVPSGSTTTYRTSSSASYASTVPSRTAAGTTTVQYQVTNPNYTTVTGTYNCSVSKASNPITISPSSLTLTYPNTGKVTVSNAQGTVTATTSAASVATASVSGTTVTVTPVAQGTATITIKAAGNDNYNEANKTVSVTVERGTCSITLTPTSAILTYPTTTTTFTVDTGTCNGTISATSSASGVASVVLNDVNTQGTVTYASAPGTATITVTSTQTDQYNAASATFEVKTQKGENTLTLSETNGSMPYSTTKSFTVKTNISGGKLSVSSSDENVATATISGTTVTISSGASYGTADITVTSAATSNYNSKTATYEITVNQGTITLNNNGATSAGTDKIYATYNTNVYLTTWGSNAMTTSANGITVPTRTGYTFGGYYDSANYTTQYIDANGKITSNGLTAGKALKANATWYAKWTANTDTKYVVNHYTKNLGATTYTLNSTENKTGTTAGELTLADLKKTITGFTYSEGFAGTATKGTTKPTSGSVITTTILADGTLVIDLYYTRNTYTMTIDKNGGSNTLTVNGTTQTGTTNVTFTCEYGATFTLPTWSSASGTANNLTKSSSVFTGWDTSSPVTCSADKTIKANWATASCSATNGTATLKSITDNKPVCTITCTTGYSQSGGANRTTSFDVTGTAGATSASGSCSAQCNVITLSPNGGTAGSVAKLYKKTGVTTWYTDNTCSADYSTDENDVKPTRTDWTFRGFYLNSTDAADISSSQSGTTPSRHLTETGATTTSGTNWTPTADTTLYAGWARNCEAGNKATCSLTVGQTTTYTTGCNTGYNIESGSGAYNPVCQANKYTVVYNKNATSATGTMSSVEHTYDADKNLTANAFTNGIKQFLGWSTSSSATTATYTNSQSVNNLTTTNNGTVTLYAVWGADCTCTKGTGVATCTATAPLGVCGTATATASSGYKNATCGAPNANGVSACTATIETYTITYYDGTTKITTLTPTSYNVTTSTITLPTYYKAGEKFVAWHSGSASGTVTTQITKGSTGNKTFYAEMTDCPLGSVCSASDITECPANSYCPLGSSIAISCSTVGGGLYKSSDAGSDKANDCFFATTAGKYLANATDTAETQCKGFVYCPSETLYYPNVNEPTACPGAELTRDSNGAIVTDASGIQTTTTTDLDSKKMTVAAYKKAYETVIDPNGDGTYFAPTTITIGTRTRTGATSDVACFADHVMYNAAGRHQLSGAYYNADTGLYEIIKTANSQYYNGYVNPGYYLVTPHSTSYCANTNNRQLYRLARECPAGKYCAGYASYAAQPSCTDTTHTYGDPSGITGDVDAGYYSTGGGTSSTPTASGNGCLSSYQCGPVNSGCFGGAGSTTECPNTCPNGYAGSDNGRETNTDCYASCSAKTIDNGTTTVVNSKEYYNGTAYPACTYNVNCDAKYGASGNKTSSPACTACTTGQYSAGGTATCSTCPGDYTAGAVATNQYECVIACAAGEYVATPNAACTNVGVGYYAPSASVAYGSISTNRGQCADGTTTIGYGAGADEAGDCGRVMNVGDGKLYLRSDRKTAPSFNVTIGSTTYYGNMSTADKNISDGATKSLKANVNDTTYSVYDDSAN